MTEFKILGILVLGLIMANQECEGPDPEPVFDYQTEFVDIIVTPDTVAVGDTVLIHAIIKDSLDTKFTFNWTMQKLIPVNGKIDGSMIKWKAIRFTNNEGEVVRYRRAVEADNGDNSKDTPVRRFDIYIKH